MVDTPAAEHLGPEIMHHIVPDACPGADPLRVDTAHVTHHTLTDVVDVIVFHHHVAEGIAWQDLHLPANQCKKASQTPRPSKVRNQSLC